MAVVTALGSGEDPVTLGNKFARKGFVERIFEATYKHPLLHSLDIPGEHGYQGMRVWQHFSTKYLKTFCIGVISIQRNNTDTKAKQEAQLIDSLDHFKCPKSTMQCGYLYRDNNYQEKTLICKTYMYCSFSNKKGMQTAEKE